MKHLILSLLAIGCICGISHAAQTEEKKPPQTEEKKEKAPEPKKETIKRNGLTLNVTVEVADFPPEVSKKMADAFFVVYPKLMAKLNPNASKTVNFYIREKTDVGGRMVPAYAHFHNQSIYFNSGWMSSRKGNDIDVVTHELTHVIQSYPYKKGAKRPDWITEGLADYARFRFGVDNEGSGWAVPEYNEKQKYTDAYRVTGRFFAWLEENTKPDILTKLDDKMRKGEYSDDFWKENTGKTIDELWADYGKNPKLKNP